MVAEVTNETDGGRREGAVEVLRVPQETKGGALFLSG